MSLKGHGPQPSKPSGRAERNLVFGLVANWRQLGLDVADQRSTDRPAVAGRFDSMVQLRSGGASWKVYIEARSRLSAGAVEELGQLRGVARELREDDPRSLACLVAPRIAPRARQALRRAEIGHADLRGLLYLRAPGLLVDVEPKPVPHARGAAPSEHAVVESEPAADPFSDRTSLVLRALLAEPARAFRLAELTEKTGITVGWVSIVARELLRRGYVARGPEGVRIADAGRALSEWTHAYEWRDNSVWRFEAPFGSDAITEKIRDFCGKGGWRRKSLALTLHSAADLIARHVEHGAVSLYVAPERREEVVHWLATRLYAEPVRESGNLHVVEPYYEHSVFFDRRLVDGLPIVSPVQLFIDLAHYPLRGSEAAGIVARTVLARELGLSSDQVKALSDSLP